MDRQPQDKDVKKVKGTQPKKYYKTLDKGLKKKEQTFLVNKNIENQMMMTITNQHQVTQVQRLKSLFILKSLNKCMVRLEI